MLPRLPCRVSPGQRAPVPTAPTRGAARSRERGQAGASGWVCWQLIASVNKRSSTTLPVPISQDNWAGFCLLPDLDIKLQQMMKICHWEESFLLPARAFCSSVQVPGSGTDRRKDRRTLWGRVSRAMGRPHVPSPWHGHHCPLYRPHGTASSAVPRCRGDTPACWAAPGSFHFLLGLIGLKEIAGSLIMKPIEWHISA